MQCIKGRLHERKKWNGSDKNLNGFDKNLKVVQLHFRTRKSETVTIYDNHKTYLLDS